MLTSERDSRSTDFDSALPELAVIISQRNGTSGAFVQSGRVSKVWMHVSSVLLVVDKSTSDLS